MNVVIDATGAPAVGIRHALLAAKHSCKIVMANVEADAFAGPLLTRKGKVAIGVYSLAYGEQSAIITKIVDCANSRVQCHLANMGTK
jgi:predicted homoserine dehydrogenase-like protein